MQFHEFVPESVRLFGFGMDSVVDILKAVELDARSRSTLGRGFTTGVSNMGIVEFDQIPRDSVDRSKSQASLSSSSKLNDLAVENGYYAVSHGRNGVLCLLSTMTINGRFSGCLQFTNPLVTEEEADFVSENLQSLLTTIIHSSR